MPHLMNRRSGEVKNMKELQTIEETLKYLQFDNWAQSAPGLARSRELLGLLGDPQKKLKFVHIAGTNGKGSTAAMLAAVGDRAFESLKEAAKTFSSREELLPPSPDAVFAMNERFNDYLKRSGKNENDLS